MRTLQFMYAEVVVNAPVPGTFHYHIPGHLTGQIRPGLLVEVSFGQQRQQAIVLRLDERAPVPETKPIARLLDATPVVGSVQIALAEWLSRTTMSHLSDCLRLFLPPGLSKRGDVLVALLDTEAQPNTETQKRVLALLKRRGGTLRGRQIARALPQANWRAAVGQLARQGAVSSQPVLDPPSARAKFVRAARLAIESEQASAAIARLRGKRQRAVLRFLAREADWVNVSWIYAQTMASLEVLKALADKDLVVLGEQEIIRDPLADRDFVPSEAPPLTPAQQGVWADVRPQLEATARPGGPLPAPILIHGVTGSGKTEIYLRALELTVRQGRQGIILVPEISLTPQTVRRFAARFPRRIGIVHSGLSDGERYDTWRRARAGHLDVIVGARSALFTPLPNLGLIVLDEAHDDSYKQSPSPAFIPPYYHARETAIELARLSRATVILGTATPDLVSYYRAARGEYCLLELPQRVLGHRRRVREQAGRFGVAHPAFRPAEVPDAVYAEMPLVHVVDMRQELRAGNRSIFSRALHRALAEVLGAGEQAILFLNRRGTATFVLCRDCGYVHACPRCGTPLTYHGSGGALMCHHCGHREPQPRQCPACHSRRIRYFGVGTELVERAVAAAFPRARTLRWDRDTTRSVKGAHEMLLEHFLHGRADVLVGTQMIAKGLDLPLVTLVGIISADVGLGLPDYRAAERTFQVLAQVAGRAGRGLLGGRVVLQTYNPDHYAIAAAAEHDYHAFYAQEIVARRELGYPPFRRLARLLFRNPQERVAQEAAERAAVMLRARIREHHLGATEVIGPAPCFFTRLADQHRWQLVVRSPDPTRVLRGLPLSPDWIVDVDPVDLL